MRSDLWSKVLICWTQFLNWARPVGPMIFCLSVPFGCFQLGQHHAQPERPLERTHGEQRGCCCGALRLVLWPRAAQLLKGIKALVKCVRVLDP